MKLTTIALLLPCLFIACNNQTSNNSSNTDTATTIHPPMDSSVTDAGSSLGNYPISPEPGIGAYDTIAAAFKGRPDARNVKQLMDTVLRQCNMEVSHKNVMRFANDLEAKRKNSKVGVTEMDILKEMYQHGTTTDLAQRLATATTVLEKVK